MRLFVTGATGSFGTSMLERLANNQFLSQSKTIFTTPTAFSRCEKKQEDLRKRLGARVTTTIGDTRDYQAVLQAMRGHDAVFHAAALKQVPNCEDNVLEAIKTNILGTENVLRAAGELGVKRVVVLSTDKACYPINAMGMTKALAEKLAISYNSKYPNTDFVCTRYGNVLRSRGSVVPLWEELAAEGKPLTITNPRMTRFLMSLSEAVDLVLLALADSRRACTYVLKSPAAFMRDVAEAISPNVVVGKIRPGEKLDETLITSEEMRRTVDCGHYFVIGQKHVEGALHAFTSASTRILSQDDIRVILQGGDNIKCSQIGI